MEWALKVAHLAVLGIHEIQKMIKKLKVPKTPRDPATRIKAVIFDCGGVLSANVPSRMLKTLAERYPEGQKDSIRFCHKNADGKPGPCYKYWNNIKLISEYTEADYWRDFKDTVKNVQEPVEELRKLLYESLHCYSDSLELAKQLKAIGVTIAICSNHSTEWLDLIANKFGFYDVFKKDLVIVSQTVRSAKPAKEIYEITLNKLREELGGNLQPSEVLFIDDKQENVAAASEMGMLGFCFNAHNQPPEVLKQALIDLHLFAKNA